MQYFQPILIVIGILAIAAVLIHGYILSRKEKVSVADNLSERDDLSSAQIDAECQDGIVGDVRIIHDYKEDESCDFSIPLETDEVAEINFDVDLSDQESASVEIADPVVGDNEAAVTEKVDASLENGQAEFMNTDSVQQPAEDHFIFNVVAKEGSAVRGHELLQFFLTAGFRFGDMSIFHRHLHPDGTGPVLFSIANMMAPGVFDPEKMEQFHSEGVSFFLTAPNNDINIKEAFDMMLVAVEQMAEEFDCVVLNANREPLTENEFRNYHERLLRYI